MMGIRRVRGQTGQALVPEVSPEAPAAFAPAPAVPRVPPAESAPAVPAFACGPPALATGAPPAATPPMLPAAPPLPALASPGALPEQAHSPGVMVSTTSSLYLIRDLHCPARVSTTSF